MYNENENNAHKHTQFTYDLFWQITSNKQQANKQTNKTSENKEKKKLCTTHLKIYSFRPF